MGLSRASLCSDSAALLALSLNLRFLNRSSLCAAVSDAHRALSLSLRCRFLLSLLSANSLELNSCTLKVFEVGSIFVDKRAVVSQK